MNSMLRRLRPSPAMVVACLALGIALGGTSYAAITLPKNSVGAKQLRSNAVTSAKVKNGSLLRADFKRGQVPAGPPGLPGPPGAQGIQGVQGTQGPPGPGARWARVRPNGTIIIQSGGITSSRTAAGQYLVDFGADVSRQLLVTSVAVSLDDSSFRGTIHTGPCAAPAGTELLIPCAGVVNPNHVAVFTRSEGNVSEDHAFYIAAIGPTAPSVSMSAGEAPSGGDGPALMK